MSTALNDNYSILPWYSALSMQYHRRRTGGGNVFRLIAKSQRLPCFQVIRTGSALEAEISQFDLVSLETGITIDILQNMIDTALIVESFTDYDIISYPALANMTDVTINEGQYYAIMGDGTNTWYSEIFWVQTYTDKFIKLQFWHDEPFVIPGGFHLSYTSPYLSTVYLDTIVNKPKYPYEFDDDDRDGYPFMLYGISNKQFRFNILVPEYMADALRSVPLHHYRTITSEGIVYYVTHIKIIPGEWTDWGDLIPLEFEFYTDTAIQATGKVKPATEGFSYDQSSYDDSHF